jgi:hypothetical protein
MTRLGALGDDDCCVHPLSYGRPNALWSTWTSYPSAPYLTPGPLRLAPHRAPAGTSRTSTYDLYCPLFGAGISVSLAAQICHKKLLTSSSVKRPAGSGHAETVDSAAKEVQVVGARDLRRRALPREMATTLLSSSPSSAAAVVAILLDAVLACFASRGMAQSAAAMLLQSSAALPGFSRGGEGQREADLEEAAEAAADAALDLVLTRVSSATAAAAPAAANAAKAREEVQDIWVTL